jgi:hypothetical protein
VFENVIMSPDRKTTVFGGVANTAALSGANAAAAAASFARARVEYVAKRISMPVAVV